MIIPCIKKQKAVFLIPAAIYFVFMWRLDNAPAQTYKNSAHGNSSTGLERSTLGPSGAGFAIGNCVHCHEQHASVGGSEPIPNTAGAAGPDIYEGFDVEENLCYGCHSSANLDPFATRPVQDKYLATDSTKTYGHNPAIAQYSHRANETSVDGISTAAHVECTDCHNPHLAKTENSRTKGSNVIGANSPLLGVSGVEFSTYPSWTTDPTIWNAAGAANYSFLDDNPAGEGYATKEYQICFKCHSSFSGNTDGWDADPGGAGEWTDVAMEFNPANNSYHPVIASLTGDQLNAEQLKGVDRTWTPGETMYCSDCHATDNAAAVGPHGSNVKWMLTGTYRNWPFTDQTSGPDTSLNGNGSATPPGGFVWARLTNSTDAETFCLNCHPDPLDQTTGVDGQSTNAHWGDTEHSTRNLACAYCHIRVPHGGSVSRLISTNTAGLPSRYTPDGSGGTPYISVFRQQTTHTNYTNADCQVVNLTASHSAAPGGGESW